MGEALVFFQEVWTIWYYSIILYDLVTCTISFRKKEIRPCKNEPGLFSKCTVLIISGSLDQIWESWKDMLSMNLGKTHFTCRNLCHLQAWQRSQEQQGTQQRAAVALHMCGTIRLMPRILYHLSKGCSCTSWQTGEGGTNTEGRNWQQASPLPTLTPFLQHCSGPCSQRQQHVGKTSTIIQPESKGHHSTLSVVGLLWRSIWNEVY